MLTLQRRVRIQNSSDPSPLRKVKMVIVNNIDRVAFHQLLSAQTASEIAVGEEVEWFADREETIFGTVGFGKRNAGWSYAMLKRNRFDDFGVCSRQEHFSSCHAARLALLCQMAGAEVVGVQRLAA